MEKSSEEVRQFAAVSATISDEEQNPVTATRSRRLVLRCCGCCAALFVINTIVSVILMFTIFKSRDPIFQINKVFVVKMELINGTNTPRPGTNATLNFDVSMKNRNFISFKHPLMTSTVYYRGAVIGEARTPPGTQRARRTMRTNITMEVIMDRFLSRPGLDSDFKSGLFTASGSSRVRGRVKILFIKMHVKMKVNCTATVNMTSMVILHQKCKKKFKL